MKPYSSPRKIIDKYKEEKKESYEKRNFNPFTPARQNKFDKKRSRKSQKSRKYRKLDMGCSRPSTAVSTWPTTTTITTIVNLSVPSGPPSTSNVPSMPKLPMHRLQYKTWVIGHQHQCYCHPWYTQTGPQRRIGMEQSRRRERISKIIRKEQRKITEERKTKEEESALFCRSCAPDLLNDEPNLPLSNPLAPTSEEKEKT